MTSPGLHRAGAALDANFAALIRWYGDRPGGAVVDHGDVVTGSTGLAFRAVNAAVEIRFGAAAIDERIAAIGDWFSARSVPWRWLAGSTATPAGLGDALVRQGFELVSDNPGMALDLAGFVAERPPTGVEIRPADTAADMLAWADINRRGLDLDEQRATAWHAAQDRSIASDSPLRNWIARLDGEPVAAAALFDAAGAAGIYNVVTVPEARGRGIGRAVTATALTAAVSRGHTLAVLGSSDLGLPVYRRLGFREVARLRSYALPADHGPVR